MKDSGVTADTKSLKLMLEKLEGKSIPELIKEGKTQMASMPSSGASAVAGAATEAPKEAAAPAKKEEEPEEEIEMGGFFGDDDGY